MGIDATSLGTERGELSELEPRYILVFGYHEQ